MASISFPLLALLASCAPGASSESVEIAKISKVDARVSAQLAEDGTTDFLVWMQSRADVSLAPNIADWQRRGWFVYDTLRAHAEASQASVRALLDDAGVEHRPFWIANVLFVRGGDAALVADIASLSEVAKISPNEVLALPPVQVGDAENTINSVEWGIDRIRAPEVWANYGVFGEEIVVANIDTGVDFTHPAVQAQYRGNLGGGVYDHNYNWHDPAHICPGAGPCDNHNHGTHTMGTMVGDDGAGNQIGVAPLAKWIAAKGCESRTCTEASLLSSGEWIAAPTDLDGLDPDPGLRPHIVNNSWGGGGGDTWYQQIVDTWVAAGIFPAFSNGNFGSACSTSSTPGDYISSYSSGAFDSGNAIASFSSRGPSSFSNEIKPNIAAPGVNVRSSIPGGGYTSHQGTSMASPHTAGAVALMWSAAPALIGDIPQTRAILDQSAVDMADTTCGGTATDNNIWGEGRLDVYAAVQQSPTGPTGYLEGTVTDASDASAIQGTRVEFSGDVDRSTVTNANGEYSQRLPVGTYNVVASVFGYLSSATTVTILEDQTHIQDFSLSPAPSHVISGRVTSSEGTGLWPTSRWRFSTRLWSQRLPMPTATTALPVCPRAPTRCEHRRIPAATTPRRVT